MKKILLIALGLYAGIFGSLWVGRATAADDKAVAERDAAEKQKHAKQAITADISLWTVFKVAQARDIKATVNVEGGLQYTAKIKDVGREFVVLKEPTGKEFYEVVVALDKIVAVELKAP